MPKPQSPSPSSPSTPRDRLKPALQAGLCAFAVALLFHLIALETGPLAGTEGHRAICAHQMVESGDWLLPRLFGELYLRKPPLHYWVLASFESVLGAQGEWVWRLPSIVEAALLAGLLGVMGRRWFGYPGGLVAGLSALTLGAMWHQSRGADLDALNTLCSVAASLMLIEVGFGPSEGKARWGWAALGGLAMGGLLLTKGHTGLMLVGGTLLGASVLTRHWRWLARPSMWVQVVIGIALAGLWVFAAWRAIEAQGLAADLRGISEAKHNVLNLAKWLRSSEAIGVLLLAGLPVAMSLAAWSAIARPRMRGVARQALPAAAQLRVRACLGAYLGGLLIFFANGVGNPRYGYIFLPMLCPIAGAAAVAWRRQFLSHRAREVLRHTLAVLAIGGPIGVLVVVLTRGGDLPSDVVWRAWAALVVSIIAGAVGTVALHRRRIRHGAILTLVVIACLSLMVGLIRDGRHGEESGLAYAAVLQPPSGEPVWTGHLIWDKPEVLYYFQQQHGASFRVKRHGMWQAESLPESGQVLLIRREWLSLGEAGQARLRVLRAVPTGRPKVIQAVVRPADSAAE